MIKDLPEKLRLLRSENKYTQKQLAELLDVSPSIVSGYESEEVDWDAFRSAPGMVGYVVQEKETLWDIAKKFFTTVEAIMEVNQKETEQVQTGDMILILKEVS